MPGPDHRFLPHLILTALIAIWSLSFVASKLALASLSFGGLVAARFWLALACVVPFLGRAAVADLRRSARAGAIAGLALSLGYLLQMAGMTETTAATGGLLAGLIVPLVGLGGFLFFGARLSARVIAGLLLAVAGIAAICWPGGDGDGRTDTLRGILLQVGSSTSYAAHVLLLTHYGRHTPIAALTVWQLAIVALAGTATAAASGFAAVGVETVVWDAKLLLLVAYLGVLASAVGIGVQAKVQHRIPPAHLALLFALQPLFAALAGWAMLGDPLGMPQLLGGTLIVLGVVVTSSDRPPD
jgi:drug/metabolite transporter (DMT)-like permease